MSQRLVARMHDVGFLYAGFMVFRLWMRGWEGKMKCEVMGGFAGGLVRVRRYMKGGWTEVVSQFFLFHLRSRFWGGKVTQIRNCN